MTKKAINQNDKFREELINTIEPNFVFNNKPINRFVINDAKHSGNRSKNKTELLLNLKKQINSIENCKLKENSRNLILGDGNVNSPVMLVGEAPGIDEESNTATFRGEVGELLDKMLLAIDIKTKNIYCSHSMNFRPPSDRQSMSVELKRYSVFLK